MSTMTTTNDQRPKPPAMSIGTSGLVIKSSSDVTRLAAILRQAQMVPKTLLEAGPAAVDVAIFWGLEAGVSPIRAVQSVAIIKGKPALYGDVLCALPFENKKVGSWSEREVGQFPNDDYGWEVTASRSDNNASMTRTFTIADAKSAQKWGNSGVWSQYPKRMLWNRARGFLVRDLFGDCLCGAISREEVEDYPENYEQHEQPAAAVAIPEGPSDDDEIIPPGEYERQPGDEPDEYVNAEYSDVDPREPTAEELAAMNH